jgi:hypothetical protein
MDWISFTLGFVAFPASLVALCHVANLVGVRCRIMERTGPMAEREIRVLPGVFKSEK